MRRIVMARKAEKASATQAQGQCACGEVRFEIDVPAIWAWHDHSSAGRRAHGGAYATYVGSWRSRFRMLAGEASVSRFEDGATGAARSFCARCGTPLFYERRPAPKIINIPRGLFQDRTGREPRYHLSMREAAEWAYFGEPLGPLKGYPGVLWERPRRKKARGSDGGL